MTVITSSGQTAKEHQGASESISFSNRVPRWQSGTTSFAFLYAVPKVSNVEEVPTPPDGSKQYLDPIRA